jgi:hypothetical protein
VFGNENLLAVDYRIECDVLYRSSAWQVEKIIPWGPDAGAWRTSLPDAVAFVPDINVSLLEELAWRTDKPRLAGWQRRAAACRFLVERWPEEVRACIRRYPSAHWQLIQFANAGGLAALQLLQTNPALGFLAAATHGATEILGQRRRKLGAHVGFPESNHAVRMLAKVATGLDFP